MDDDPPRLTEIAFMSSRKRDIPPQSPFAEYRKSPRIVPLEGGGVSANVLCSPPLDRSMESTLARDDASDNFLLRYRNLASRRVTTARCSLAGDNATVIYVTGRGLISLREMKFPFSRCDEGAFILSRRLAKCDPRLKPYVSLSDAVYSRILQCITRIVFRNTCSRTARRTEND